MYFENFLLGRFLYFINFLRGRFFCRFYITTYNNSIKMKNGLNIFLGFQCLNFFVFSELLKFLFLFLGIFNFSAFLRSLCGSHLQVTGGYLPGLKVVLRIGYDGTGPIWADPHDHIWVRTELGVHHRSPSEFFYHHFLTGAKFNMSYVLVMLEFQLLTKSFIISANGL